MMRTGVLAALLLLTCSVAAMAADRDPPAYVQSLRSYYRSVKAAQLALEVDVFLEVDGSRDLKERDRVNVNVDPERRQLRVYRQRVPIPGGASGPFPVAEQAFFGTEYLRMSGDPATLSARNVSSRTEVLPRDWSRFTGLSVFGILFGYLPMVSGEPELTAILSGLDLSIEQREVAGESAQVLLGASPRFSVRVCFDDRRRMPVMIEFDQQADDFQFSPVTRYAFEVQEANEIDGIHFPSAFTVSTTRSASAGQHKTHHEVVKVTRTSVGQLIPDSAFLPTLKIADGTSVRMEDASQLAFAWHDGKAVPSPRSRPPHFGERLLKPAPSSSIARYFWVGLNVVLILLLITVISIKARLKKAQADS